MSCSAFCATFARLPVSLYVITLWHLFPSLLHSHKDPMCLNRPFRPGLYSKQSAVACWIHSVTITSIAGCATTKETGGYCYSAPLEVAVPPLLMESISSLSRVTSAGLRVLSSLGAGNPLFVHGRV